MFKEYKRMKKYLDLILMGSFELTKWMELGDKRESQRSLFVRCYLKTLQIRGKEKCITTGDMQRPTYHAYGDCKMVFIELLSRKEDQNQI